LQSKTAHRNHQKSRRSRQMEVVYWVLRGLETLTWCCKWKCKNCGGDLTIWISALGAKAVALVSGKGKNKGR